jgi:hypothetical protein
MMTAMDAIALYWLGINSCAPVGARVKRVKNVMLTDLAIKKPPHKDG